MTEFTPRFVKDVLGYDLVLSGYHHTPTLKNAYSDWSDISLQFSHDQESNELTLGKLHEKEITQEEFLALPDYQKRLDKMFTTAYNVFYSKLRRSYHNVESIPEKYHFDFRDPEQTGAIIEDIIRINDLMIELESEIMA